MSFLTHQHLTHLTHAEDLPLRAGEVGYHHALGALKAVNDQLEGKMNPSKVAIKYDGSPSIVFGHNPENGKFFVASKSAFNQTPKLNYSVEDIQKNHGHDPGLVEKLASALEHLKRIAPKTGVYQGDLMYSEDDKHESKDHYNFTPNTIMYSIPKKSDEGKKVATAKIGIAIHTQYHGSTIAKMKASGNVNTAAFQEHKDVHVLPHEVNLGDALITGKDQTSFEHNIKAAERVHNQLTPNALSSVSDQKSHLDTYFNHTVREGKKPSLTGYRLHLLNHGKKQVEGVKTAGAKQRHFDVMKKNIEHLEHYEHNFDRFFRLHRHLALAKDALVSQLKTTTHGYEHSIGGKEASPEGFVVHHEGYPIKLVNRAEFSRANFEQSKNRK
jgi:hypothetical protein